MQRYDKWDYLIAGTIVVGIVALGAILQVVFFAAVIKFVWMVVDMSIVPLQPLSWTAALGVGAGLLLLKSIFS